MRAANPCPCQVNGLEDFVEAGLRNELKDFYREMRKKMQSSGVPSNALIALKKM